ncbi:MAG: NlpC/P60 family protein [Actinomycetota bacterium]
MRPLPPRILLPLSLVAALLFLPAQQAFAFSDVPRGHWAYEAIQYVASENTWMQDYGPDSFRPDARETRSFLARTLVTVYAPTEPADPSITFPDLPADDPFYPFANVAVKLGWMNTYQNGNWNGGRPVRVDSFDQAIVLALGLADPVAGLANIRQEDGTPYVVDRRFPHMQLARWLDLHYDHDDERQDLQRDTRIARDEVAYSLWKATTMPSHRLEAASIFNDVTLPANVHRYKRRLTQYSLNQVGYPYIFAGEWHRKSPPGYCCGFQPQGGFDCSGFAWWVLKRSESGYDSAQFRNYPGWSLRERVSRYMAKATNYQRSYEELDIGNLMFFASNGGDRWEDVSHMGIYLGNNWMVHSTGGGPQLQWVGDGWYREHFVWGRRLTNKNSGPEQYAPGADVTSSGATAGEYAIAP